MPILEWDKVGARTYETGVDRGVLYLPDGSAVPWNGLTEVVEKFDKQTAPVYFDGMKINELVTLGSFSASLKAVTYPDEFVELEGLGEVRHGMFVGDQMPQQFGLCYRNRIGNDLESEASGYKIHLIYNITAIPSDKTFQTISADPGLSEFEWDLVAIPEDVPGFRPTAHLVIDSRDFDPWLMEELEALLYGGSYSEAALLPMSELVEFLRTWCRYHVTDLGDGTYKVEWTYPHGVTFSGTDDEVFKLIGIYAVYSDEETFTIADTCDISDVPEIKIIDNGDGTWTATTAHNTLFAVTPEGWFQIFNANAVFVTPDKYKLSDTVEG